MIKFFTFGKGLLFTALICFSINAQAKITLGSYNIRTYDSKKSPTDKRELKKIIRSMKADFITVEEIVNASSFKAFIKKSFPNYGVYLSKCGGGGKQKIGFLYSKRIFKLKKVYEDNRLSDPGNIVGQYGCGRLRPALVGIFTHLKTREEFVAVGVHLKAGGSSNNYIKRAKQYEIVSRIVDELRLADYKNIALMGDFNSTGYLDQDQDYINFQNMLAETNMTSSSENLQCTSYWSGKNRSDDIEEPSVLDHVVYSGTLLGKTPKKVTLLSHCKKVLCKRESAETLGRSYKKVSDHCPITVTFE